MTAVCVSCGFGGKIGCNRISWDSGINKKQLSVWILQELSITESSFLFSKVSFPFSSHLDLLSLSSQILNLQKNLTRFLQFPWNKKRALVKEEFIGRMKVQALIK